MPAHVKSVAALSALVRKMLTTQVGVARRPEDGACLLPVPATSVECLIALSILYNFEPHERLRSGGIDALPGVVSMAMYIDAPTVVQFILSWASDVVGDNAPDVLRFATTVAVRQDLCPDLQQRVMRLTAEALLYIGWSCLLRNSDSGSVEALGTLLAIDFNTLSELLWSIFVDSRTDPCTGFIGFLVLWARHRPLRLVDVATLLLKLSDQHEPFARALYQICVSVSDLRQIQKFVSDHVSDPSYQLLLIGALTGFPLQRPGYEEKPYAVMSPGVYEENEEEDPQTPGYAPRLNGTITVDLSD